MSLNYFKLFLTRLNEFKRATSQLSQVYPQGAHTRRAPSSLSKNHLRCVTQEKLQGARAPPFFPARPSQNMVLS